MMFCNGAENFAPSIKHLSPGSVILSRVANLIDYAKQVREFPQRMSPFEPFIIAPNRKPLFAVNVRQDVEIMKIRPVRIQSSKQRYEATFVTWRVSEPAESASGHSNWPRNYNRNHRTSFDAQSWTPFPTISDGGNFSRE
jgi:hypothetical protein